MEDDVGVVQRGHRGSTHGLLQRIPRVEQAWCVEDHHLDVVGGADADYTVARRLRLGADDAELFADDAVEEGRLAGVRLSDNGDDSGSGHSRKLKGMVGMADKKQQSPESLK